MKPSIVTAQPTAALPDSVDFVLVTALAEERDTVLDKLPGYRQLPPTKDDIRTYFQTDLPVTFPDNSTGRYRAIVMCLLGMGRLQAGMATADAIRRWHPRYVILVGIAGGIAARDIQIGDILISDQVVDYELQKLTPEGPKVRWDIQRADARLLNACNNFRNENWEELIKMKRPGRGTPNRHIGPIASGDKVIAFGDVLARYQDVWPKLIGVEMEAAGAATAAFQSPDRPGFFMVRGVSDLADENKDSSDVQKWRSYACDSAASFTIALLRSGPIPLSEGAAQTKTKQVQLIYEGEISEFTPNRQQEIVGVLATLMKIDPSNIRILQVYQGSIVMILEMPDSAANRLYKLATSRDFRLMSMGIKSVSVADRAIVELTQMAVGVPDNRPEQLPHILVVEDEPAWGDQFRDILESMGYDSDVVQDDKEAKIVLENNHYALVLLDAALDQPNFSIRCQEFCDFLHRRYPDVPIVATSGKQLSPPEVWTLAQLGIVDFIYKPMIQLREFKRRIQDALSIQTGQGIPPPSPHTSLSRLSIDPSHIDPTTLRRVIHRSYTRPQLEILCNDMGIGYDDLQGEVLENKIMYLIVYCQRRERYEELVRKVLTDHP